MSHILAAAMLLAVMQAHMVTCMMSQAAARLHRVGAQPGRHVPLQMLAAAATALQRARVAGRARAAAVSASGESQAGDSDDDDAGDAALAAVLVPLMPML
jgi:hypothetical protein